MSEGIGRARRAARREGREQGCVHRLLAKSDGAAVSLCTCGRIHLNLGDVTLRVAPDQLGQLSGTLGRAVLAMRVSEQRPAGALLC